MQTKFLLAYETFRKVKIFLDNEICSRAINIRCATDCARVFTSKRVSHATI